MEVIYIIPQIVLEDIKTGETIESYGDWGLILNSKEIPLPSPKTELIENEGGDGTIDLSEATGDEIKYKDRVNKYTFSLLDKFADLPTKISMIANKIHGKRFKIIHYDDLNYYYIGRLSINGFTINKAKGKFTLEATCYPYKYKKSKTYYEATIDGTEDIVLYNERKRTVPTITVSSVMRIRFEDKEISLSAGTYEYLNMYLKEGATNITVTGTGTIKIEWQEASL